MASAAETATQAMQRAAALLKRAEGIQTAFTITSQGQTASGKLKISGKRFAITTPQASTWYDGKTMWTYNPRTQETTMTLPTASEVAETNPLMLVSDHSSQFTASFAKHQPKQGRTIVLTPRTRSLGIRTMTVTLSSGGYIPVSIEITPSSGSPSTIKLSGFDTKKACAASDFIYPKAKYPKAEIVDLR